MVPFSQMARDVLDADDVIAATHALGSPGELAVDVEANAMHAFRARLCYVQVATDDHLFLFDTLRPDVPAGALAPLFSDATRTKFFHAAGGDLQYLAEAGVRVDGLFDTHLAATLLGAPRVGLSDLARDLLGVTLEKEHQQADFSQRPLPPAVRTYIADDVRYLCEIGRRVREACRAADILEEVELSCRREAEEAVGRPEIPPLKSRAPSELPPKQRALAEAIAQTLHAFRLRLAEAADLPMGQVLSNAAILATAAAPPVDARSLSRKKGVRGAFVREHGDEVVAMVRELLERSRRGELAPVAPPPPRDPAEKRREGALKGFRQERATARKVTPGVVLPNALVDELARAAPRTLDELSAIPYFGEKRLRLYGGEILEVLRSI